MRTAGDLPTDTSPEALGRAVEANINARPRLRCTRMPGVAVIDEPGLLGMMTGWPDSLVNSVYWAAFALEQATARIDLMLDRFRRCGCLPVS